MATTPDPELKILCLGPQDQPRTGQSLATDIWVSLSRHDIASLNNNLEGQSKFRRFLASLHLPIQTFKLARTKRPQALYLSLKRSLLGLATDLACILAYRSIIKGPVVIHLHGADLIKARQSPLFESLLHRLWNYVTDAIILSPRMKEQFEGLPERPLHVVTNVSEHFATETDLTQKIEKRDGASLSILYLSNLLYSKGFSYLIEAVKTLQKQGKNINLTLAGRPLADPYMSAIEAKKCLEDGLENGISYIGSVHGTEKWELLQKADIVALPTFYPTEAQPICLIEAMAFGAIPLATYHNYNEDYLDPSYAVFADKRCAKSLANALETLATQPQDIDRRMRTAYQQANAHHRPSHYASKIDDIFKMRLEIQQADRKGHDT